MRIQFVPFSYHSDFFSAKIQIKSENRSISNCFCAFFLRWHIPLRNGLRFRMTDNDHTLISVRYESDMSSIWHRYETCMTSIWLRYEFDMRSTWDHILVHIHSHCMVTWGLEEEKVRETWGRTKVPHVPSALCTSAFQRGHVSMWGIFSTVNPNQETS